MVKIPSLSRRTEPVPTDDDAGARDRAEDTGRADRPVVSARDSDQATYRSSAAAGADGRATGPDGRGGDAERRAAERAAVARAATARPADDDTRRNPRIADADPALERTVDGRTVDLDRDAAAARAAGTDRDRRVDHPVDRDGDGVADRTPERPAVAGPKPRASLLATLGLVVGVAGALFVLTGTLAGYGIGLGAVGAVLAVLGLVATRRRHIAGKTDALLGIAFGLGAVVLGVLAITGQFDWPTTDGDWVGRLREWLDSQFADRL
ncbi:UbiA family prenyltransferase [Micromonospora sp. NPDC052213]|uniref:UbiA family prenyltransferase n=1 Tax=Micromonospora sp. NPDC052213 TaxID=3155812 RepID=UPI003449C144